MTPNEAEALIDATKGRVFSLYFIKRTNGQERKMLARTGVTSYLKGGTPPFDPADYGLVCVFDMENLGYRNIPLDGLIEIRYARRVWPVEQEEENGQS